MKAGWTASLLVLFLCAAPTPTVGAESGPTIPEPVRVPAGPGAPLNPVVAVDRHGMAAVAWVQRSADDGAIEIRLAQAPDWRPATVATVAPGDDPSPERATALHPLLVAGDALHLAWAEPSATTMTVWRYTLGAGPAEAWGEEVPYTAAIAASSTGDLQAVWAEENGLFLADGTAPLAPGLTLDGAVAPAEIDLALDTAGRPHAAWAGWQQIDQDAGIYYAALDADVAPTRVDASGRAPRVAVGPRGTVHLCWWRAEGLQCADSRDWERISAVAPPLPDERVALAVGPNDVAHVVWSADGALWYANSGDWAAARRLADLDATQLSMAVDGAGRPHVAATVGVEDGGSELYVVMPFSPEPQLAVVAPATGAWLADGDPLVAEANLPASAWQRVSFYLRPDAPSDARASGAAPDDALIFVGTDYDGRDGWSVPYDAALLGAGLPSCRVVAVGVDVEGGVTVAVSEWMTALPPGGEGVWVVQPGPEVVQGLGEVWVMAPGLAADPRRLEVSLTAPGCPTHLRPGECTCTIPSRTHLVTSVDVASSKARLDSEWLVVSYDSRQIPDGVYHITAAVTDGEGRVYRSVAAGSVTVDNDPAPVVRVTEPRPEAIVWGTFEAAAEVRAEAAPVQRVDFYGERQRTVLQRSQGPDRFTVEAPDVVWLGSDTDGDDGWGISINAAPHLDGDAWVLRAVAHDADGRAAEARSTGTFAIIGRDRPAPRFSLPPPGAELAGVVPVDIQVTVGGRHVEGVDLYAETLGERLIPVGALEERAGRWVLDWDTATLPDGDYDLVAVVRHADGRTSLARCSGVRVHNAQSGYRFVEPEGEAPLGGTAVLRLEGSGDTSAVRVYYRNARGRLRPIGLATRLADVRSSAADGWSLVWDTAGVLDGAYDLVAAVHGADGQVHYVERRVEVRSAVGPSLVVWPATGDEVDGVLRIAWQVAGDADVALEWSPDGGVHWVALATDLGADGYLDWDTTQVPDTPHAMLRLVTNDGWRRSSVETGPFTIDNVNEAPRAALLAPTAGAALGVPVFVVWRAWDPDGDPLTVDLDYRHGLGGWQPLAHGLADAGSFSWDTSRLAPAAEFLLRLTVCDPDGARTSAEVADLSLLANRPPEVQLVTPNERTLLRGDAVVLWQAEDPDGDPLLIDLYYSDDAGQTWLPLAEGIDNTGYYVWQVFFLPMGSRYRVRVVARDGFYRVSDDSDGMLIVGGTLPPAMALLRPVAGARLAGVVPVQWESQVAVTTNVTVTVSVRPAGDSRWHPLVEDAPDDGLYVWDTTGFPDGAYELRVILSDGRGGAAGEVAAVVPVTVANRRNERPNVVLDAPAGGEAWRGVHEISWRAWDDDGDPLTAVIAVSADGGATWEDLARVDARLGRYLWDTGAWQGVHPLLARVVVSDGMVTAQAITSAPFFVVNGAAGPAARFLSPDADGVLWRDDIVTWEVGSMGGAPARVSLALRREDGAAAPDSAWQPVIEAVYDAGEAVIPAGWLKPGRLYRLRLTADDGALRVDTLSTPFRIVTAGREPPTVALEEPAGEAWSGEREVRWEAHTPGDRDLRATLELSRDGGVTWFDLARDQTNTGRYAWDTATVANGVYRLRLTVGDDLAESTVVSPPFAVDNPGRSAPTISLLAPHRGEVWAGTREVRWRAADADGDALTVTLAYSLDGGGTWRRFAYNVPATEGYLWDTTTVPNGAAVWLRATVSDGLLVAGDYAGPFCVRNAQSPVVVLLEPRGGEQWSGERRIAWYTAQGSGRTAKTMLQYSADRGRTWQTIAHELPAEGTYRWDTSVLADGAEVLVRAYVSDGQQAAVATTRSPVRVRRHAPNTEAPFYLP